MQIFKLPVHIQEIVINRQLEQGNNPNRHLHIYDTKEDGNFKWGDTKEGESIWQDVSVGIYTPFYIFHNINTNFSDDTEIVPLLTENQLDDILEKLDDYARNIDHYSYGLPSGTEDRINMREIIINVLNN